MYYIKCIVKKTNSSDFIVVENNNIGYKIYTNLKPKKDEELIMYLSVIHNDDEIIYTGFADEIELETFNVLTSINGIGHKTGLKILKQANYKKLLYLCVNDLHSELLKISHINVENYLSISCTSRPLSVDFIVGPFLFLEALPTYSKDVFSPHKISACSLSIPSPIV